MVVKPLAMFAATTSRGLVQPALKTRGREYLRIIYGPSTPAGQPGAPARPGLGREALMALREFALGIEALERFVRSEPLGASTSACSASSRWKASLWTRGVTEGTAAVPAPAQALPPCSSSLARSLLRRDERHVGLEEAQVILLVWALKGARRTLMRWPRASK